MNYSSVQSFSKVISRRQLDIHTSNYSKFVPLLSYESYISARIWHRLISFDVFWTVKCVPTTLIIIGRTIRSNNQVMDELFAVYFFIFVNHFAVNDVET